ncbi:conserved hypothetical protein [Neospora caninum Liverpool]|nr:conserved hypothetical protein [Neospora caninum Liverpool]CBZ52459.1 conserved hypothetical protein [Neospora caninum Liverpool]|eukprot:XP_003882491.1 conserved hypothetical protein [Neospora caninum Liverpool]
MFRGVTAVRSLRSLACRRQCRDISRLSPSSSSAFAENSPPSIERGEAGERRMHHLPTPSCLGSLASLARRLPDSYANLPQAPSGRERTPRSREAFGASESTGCVSAVASSIPDPRTSERFGHCSWIPHAGDEERARCVKSATRENPEFLRGILRICALGGALLGGYIMLIRPRKKGMRLDRRR